MTTPTWLFIDEAEAADGLLESLRKRQEACKNIPPCPKCQATDVQLMAWVTKVIWRCRVCKHVY